MNLEELNNEKRELTRNEMLKVLGGKLLELELTGTNHTRTDAGAHTNDDYGDAD